MFNLRWRAFLSRDKLNLDLFWLKDESLEDSANLAGLSSMPEFPRHTQNLDASRRKVGSRFLRAANARFRHHRRRNRWSDRANEGRFWRKKHLNLEDFREFDSKKAVVEIEREPPSYDKSSRERKNHVPSRDRLSRRFSLQFHAREFCCASKLGHVDFHAK